MVSPNFPANYPDGSDCDYVMDAGEQTVIVLTFQVFQVEGKFGQFPSVRRAPFCESIRQTFGLFSSSFQLCL